MLVPTAENDRFRVFRRGSVVDPCGRVDTRQIPRRGAYLRARFREAEQIARKGDVARVNNEIPYRYLPPANCIRSECRTSDACPYGRE